MVRRQPVQVAVRCRPSGSRDAPGGGCVTVDGDAVKVRSGEEEAAFTFDSYFGPEAEQSDVYDALVTSPMEALFDGYNSTILAYGQTGSGKTFSMVGSEDDPGIIPRFSRELFERASVHEGAKVHASYLQLYNEAFMDLFEPLSGADLRLRRSETRGVYVQGLSEKRLHSAGELARLLESGEQNRVVADTTKNAESSRSHVVLTLSLTMPAVEGRGKFVTSRAALVDLAGSERAKDLEGGAALRRQESIAINQSLTTLGLVISTLASRDHGGKGGAQQEAHVPYRNSKLTHLLKDSLGGSALTVMLCTVSPSAAAITETLNTLHFASRARSVVNIGAKQAAQALEREKERERRASTGGGGDRDPARRGGGGGDPARDGRRERAGATPQTAPPPRRMGSKRDNSGGGPRATPLSRGSDASLRSGAAPPSRDRNDRTPPPERLHGSGGGGGGGGGAGRGTPPPPSGRTPYTRDRTSIGSDRGALLGESPERPRPQPVHVPHTPCQPSGGTNHGSGGGGGGGGGRHRRSGGGAPPSSRSAWGPPPGGSGGSYGGGDGCCSSCSYGGGGYGGGYGGGGGGSYAGGSYGGGGGAGVMTMPMPTQPSSPPPLTHMSHVSHVSHMSKASSYWGGNGLGPSLDARLDASFEVSADGQVTMPAPQLHQLRERLRNVGQARDRAEEEKAALRRAHDHESKRGDEAARERSAEVERLKLEVAQLHEREEGRKRMSHLEEEVRSFKTSGATKLLQLELSTLRERDAYHRKKLAEAEEETRASRAGHEKRLGEVEGQRAKEVELHEKRVVKLMNVLEALTVAGDAKADVRVLAEKTNRVREVRELLDEERALVKTFQRRLREATDKDYEGERDGYRRRIAELEAEAKMLKTFAETQEEESRQAHGREVEIVQKQLADSEEDKKQLRRSWEGRLHDMQSRRAAESSEKERQALISEEGLKQQLHEARREAEVAAEQAELAIARTGGASHAHAAHALQQRLDAEAEAHAQARLLMERRGLDLDKEREARTLARAEVHELQSRLNRSSSHGATSRGELVSRLTRTSSARLLFHTMSRWQLVARRGRAARMVDKINVVRRQMAAAHGVEVAEMSARNEALSFSLETARQQLETQQEMQHLALRRASQVELEMAGMDATKIKTESEAMLSLQAEAEALRSRLVAEAREVQRLKSHGVQEEQKEREHAARFAAADARTEELSASLERYELEVEALKTNDERLKERMSARILHQMLNSATSKCFVAWSKYVQAEARRKVVERTQADLQRQIDDAATLLQTEEEKAEAKREKMARRLLGASLQRNLALVFGAWRADTAGTRQLRIEGHMAQLALAKEVAASESKERLAKKLGRSIGKAAAARCFRAWSDWQRQATRQRAIDGMATLQAQLHDEMGRAVEESDGVKDALSGMMIRMRGKELEQRIFRAWRWALAQDRLRLAVARERRLSLAAETRAASAQLQGLTGALAQLQLAAETGELLAERCEGLEGTLVLARSSEAEAGGQPSGVLAARMQAQLNAAASVARENEARSQTLQRGLEARTAEAEGLRARLVRAEGKLMSADDVKEALATRAGRRQLLAAVLTGWRDACGRERAARRLEGHNERRATAAAFVGRRRRAFQGWKQLVGEARRHRLRQREERGVAKREAMVARLFHGKVAALVARCFRAWRGVCAGSAGAGGPLGWRHEKLQLEQRLRMEAAGKQAEVRRVEKLQWEARLEAQARIAELEHALRHEQLGGRNDARQAELKVEERRLAESRGYKLQLSELQNELRLERLQRDAQARAMAGELGHQHAGGVDAAELQSLREDRRATLAAKAAAEQRLLEAEAERDQLSRAKALLEEKLSGASAASGDWLAEQNLQLRQITQLQLVVAELQAELSRKDEMIGVAQISGLPPQTVPVPAPLSHLDAYPSPSPPRSVSWAADGGGSGGPGSGSGGGGSGGSPVSRYASPPRHHQHGASPLRTPQSASQRVLGFLGFGGDGGGGGGGGAGGGGGGGGGFGSASFGSDGVREAALSEQLESREAEAVALQVELANLKSALAAQERRRGDAAAAADNDDDAGPALMAPDAFSSYGEAAFPESWSVDSPLGNYYNGRR